MKQQTEPGFGSLRLSGVLLNVHLSSATTLLKASARLLGSVILSFKLG